MHVDPQTLLFTEMTDDELADLRLLAESIVLQGETAYGHPLFDAWCAVAGYSDPHDSRKLLVMSTVFPQRALLSILRLKGL